MTSRGACSWSVLETYVKFLPKDWNLSMIAVTAGWYLIVCVFEVGLLVVEVVTFVSEACFQIEGKRKGASVVIHSSGIWHVIK